MACLLAPWSLAQTWPRGKNSHELRCCEDSKMRFVGLFLGFCGFGLFLGDGDLLVWTSSDNYRDWVTRYGGGMNWMAGTC